MKPLYRLFRSASLLCWLLLCLILNSCKADEAPARGQLMVVLQTDMSLPKDVTQVKIVVKVGDKPYLDKNYIIAPGQDWVTRLPATLAVVASTDDPTPVVDVQVVGLRKKEARVFAHAITTIPERRIATLYVPIQWLCEDTVVDLKEAGYSSTCEPEKGQERACVAGSCQNVTVKESDLKDFDEKDVFGGAEIDSKLGLCFETVACFDKGFKVLPDADCVVEVEVADGFALNLALTNPANGDGICNDDESACYIPLDRNDLFGWKYATGSDKNSDPIRAQLPKAVCEKLDAGEVSGVQATLACATKTIQFPTCGPWSSVEKPGGAGDPPPPPPPVETETDAGSDAGTDAGTQPLTLSISFVDDGAPVEIGIEVPLRLLAATGSGDAGSVDVTADADWASSNTDVATVEAGVVTGQSVGDAEITASYQGEVTTFQITVERGTPTQIVVAGNSDPIPAGRSTALTATATYANDSTEDITELATWTSDNEPVATVDGGTVTTLQQGSANICASLNDRTSDSFVIEVGPAVLDKLTIVALSKDLNAVQLGVNGTYSDGSVVDVSDQVLWEQIDGEEFGSVNATGLVTGTAVGTVVVQASVGDISTRANINVTPPGSADGGT